MAIHQVRNARRYAGQSLGISHGKQDTAVHGGAKSIVSDPTVSKKYRPFGSTPPGAYPTTPTGKSWESGTGTEGDDD